MNVTSVFVIIVSKLWGFWLEATYFSQVPKPQLSITPEQVLRSQARTWVLSGWVPFGTLHSLKDEKLPSLPPGEPSPD